MEYVHQHVKMTGFGLLQWVWFNSLTVSYLGSVKNVKSSQCWTHQLMYPVFFKEESVLECPICVEWTSSELHDGEV